MQVKRKDFIFQNPNTSKNISLKANKEAYVEKQNSLESFPKKKVSYTSLFLTFLHS